MLQYWLAHGRETESLHNFVLQHRIGNLKENIEDPLKKRINNFVSYVDAGIKKCCRIVPRYKAQK